MSITEERLFWFSSILEGWDGEMVGEREGGGREGGGGRGVRGRERGRKRKEREEGLKRDDKPDA